MNSSESTPYDHCKYDEHGAAYAGDHVLIEMWGASGLADPAHISEVLVRAARAANATVLHQHFHHFGVEQGVSGVIVLAESHMSIHSWPERAYAALDIFMCGDCNPLDCIDTLKLGFNPDEIEVEIVKRGRFTRAEKVA